MLLSSVQGTNTNAALISYYQGLNVNAQGRKDLLRFLQATDE